MNILDETAKKPRESCEVIYDDYFDIEYVDLSRENQQELQIISKNERHFKSETISTNPHSKAANHLHDFITQENIPVYHSYHDQPFMPVYNHGPLSESQDGSRGHSDPIIIVNPYER